MLFLLRIELLFIKIDYFPDGVICISLLSEPRKMFLRSTVSGSFTDWAA